MEKEGAQREKDGAEACQDHDIGEDVASSRRRLHELPVAARPPVKRRRRCHRTHRPRQSFEIHEAAAREPQDQIHDRPDGGAAPLISRQPIHGRRRPCHRQDEREGEQEKSRRIHTPPQDRGPDDGKHEEREERQHGCVERLAEHERTGADRPGELPSQSACRRLGNNVPHREIADEEQRVDGDAGQDDQEDERDALARLLVGGLRRQRSGIDRDDRRKENLLAAFQRALHGERYGHHRLVRDPAGVGLREGPDLVQRAAQNPRARVENVHQHARELLGDLRQDPLRRVADEIQRCRFAIEESLGEPFWDAQERRGFALLHAPCALRPDHFHVHVRGDLLRAQGRKEKVRRDPIVLVLDQVRQKKESGS